MLFSPTCPVISTDRLCENTVHGSTRLTTNGVASLEIEYLSVRPEHRRRAPREFSHSLPKGEIFLGPLPFARDDRSRQSLKSGTRYVFPMMRIELTATLPRVGRSPGSAHARETSSRLPKVSPPMRIQPAPGDPVREAGQFLTTANPNRACRSRPRRRV